MRRSASVTAVVFALVLVSGSHADVLAQTDTTLDQGSSLYHQALTTMRQLPQPSKVAFTANLTATGMRMALVRVGGPNSDCGGLELGFGTTRQLTPTVAWTGLYTSSDDVTHISDSGQTFIVTSPMYDPTWQGAYDWLRFGFQGTVLPRTCSERAVLAAPIPLVTPASTLPEIATVTVFAPSAYVITDAGPATCSDGAPGRHLHFVARADPANHPLTDVVVDSESRFCSMRFNTGAASFMSMTGSFELHFAKIGPYWLVQSGTAAFTMRTFGIVTKNANVAFSYSNFSFPE